MYVGKIAGGIRKMTLEEPKKEKLEDEEECPHFYVVICDVGYSTVCEGRRDIGLKCKDCSLEWDVHLERGKQGASIERRLILDKVLDKALGESWESLEP